MSDKIGNNTRGRAGLGRPRGALNVNTRTIVDGKARDDEV
jgi:hypothetical protein